MDDSGDHGVDESGGGSRADGADLDRVADLFDLHLDAGLHHGAQLAVRHEGDLVLDLAGGVAGPDEAAETTPDTRHVLFSCTKPYAATCLHLLVDRGEVAYDDRVVDHWPDFAWPGEPKAETTVEHVLTHRAGLAESPIDADPDAWLDWAGAIETLERLDPATHPGERAAYHSLTFGFLVGELVRRVDGRPVDRFAREELFDPLGMDRTSIGLPDDAPDDVADCHGFEPFDRCRDPGFGLGDFTAEAAAAFNREDVRRAVVPASTGVGTARDMARFYDCLANGGELDGTRLCRPETVASATELRATVDRDATLGVPKRYARGFERAGLAHDKYGSAPERVFGHGGLGSVVGWADPDERIAVAYVTNGIRDEFEHRSRTGEIADAVRAALT